MNKLQTQLNNLKKQLKHETNPNVIQDLQFEMANILIEISRVERKKDKNEQKNKNLDNRLDLHYNFLRVFLF